MSFFNCRYSFSATLSAYTATTDDPSPRPGSSPGRKELSIAVLYFENLSGVKEDEYLRDGITEDITTELSKIKGLKIFSRAMVLAYRDKPVTAGHVGKELGASYAQSGGPASHQRRSRGRSHRFPALVRTV